MRDVRHGHLFNGLKNCTLLVEARGVIMSKVQSTLSVLCLSLLLLPALATAVPIEIETKEEASEGW